MSLRVFFLLFCCCAWSATWASPSPIPDEDSGYVEINRYKFSHMFYWLFGAANRYERASAPLVMWLQGGPGGSSTGWGNILEVGPRGLDGQYRNHTWQRDANLLFVDQPVGTGYSYTRDDGFCKSEKDVARDLLIFFKQFLAKYPGAFNHTPFWIFAESYGGKMATSFGLALSDAIQRGEIHINFQGVALGDSWIEPVVCLESYKDYLLATSLVTENEAEKIHEVAKQARVARSRGEYEKATGLWGRQQALMSEYTGSANVYDFRLHHSYPFTEPLDAYMNGPMRKHLRIPEHVVWGEQSSEVFRNMRGDFMQSMVPGVDELLHRGHKVWVYSGQMDIIVNTLCSERWVQQLKWPGLKQFNHAEKTSHYDEAGKEVVGFSRAYRNFGFYWIFRAGHLVPRDQPHAAHEMFRVITGLQHNDQQRPLTATEWTPQLP